MYKFLNDTKATKRENNRFIQVKLNQFSSLDYNNSNGKRHVTNVNEPAKMFVVSDWTQITVSLTDEKNVIVK